jgi:glycerol-3-phosphate dehydrogenase subunit B
VTSISPGWAAPAYDVLVIGAGLAGLTAATRLAEGGAKVMVLAKGVGATHLAPGTIDVLGYAGGPDRVERPEEALGALDGAHPYRRVGAGAVGAAIEWFKRQFEGGPLGAYGYRGDLARNVVLPTTVGAFKPSAVVPETMAAGDLGDDAPMLVVGFRALRDFHAAYLADNVSRGGVEARAIVLDRRVDGRPEANSLGLARAFDEPDFRAEVAAEVARALDGAARVGFPAGLGLEDPAGAWSDLRERLGRPVFEIPTLPPSVPGMRIFDAMRAALRSAGGRLIMGSEVIGAVHDGARISAVRAHAAGHDIRYHARWFVLATGGFASGAIALGSDWITRETVLGLPLRGVPAPGEPRFVGPYMAEQPMARAGVAVDGALRAEGAENVLVAGASLPGAVPWQEGSGEGIALSSGHRAAEIVLAEGVAVKAAV